MNHCTSSLSRVTLLAAATVCSVFVMAPPVFAAPAPPPALPGFGCYHPTLLTLGLYRTPPLCVASTNATCEFWRSTLGLCTFWFPDKPSCEDRCLACGDGIIDNGAAGTVDLGEECDDGNVDNGDGCNNSCRLEKVYCCDVVGNQSLLDPIATKNNHDSFMNYTGNDCTIVDPLGFWQPNAVTELDNTIPCECGNGMIDGAEECDLGRAQDGSNRNTILNGCNKCDFTCGDQKVQTDAYVIDHRNPTDWVYADDGSMLTEQCDDGNWVDDDECDNFCQLCGNGQLDPGEQCDLGRGSGGDSRNLAEYGCTPECKFVCGNGTVDASSYVVDASGTDWYYDSNGGIPYEACDDGNIEMYDGCDENCQEEVSACCDYDTGFGTENLALTKPDCDGNGHYFTKFEVNDGVEEVTDAIADEFCKKEGTDKYCCGPNEPYTPVLIPGAKIISDRITDCMTANTNGGLDVYNIGPLMGQAEAAKACKPVYCENHDCDVYPKFDCGTGYDLDWTPPADSVHKPDMVDQGYATNQALDFCEFWLYGY